MNKSELILEYIIKEYLINNEPIGSSELKSRANIDLSPSTIRFYFKRLSEDGSISQVHISSGRIPTQEALKSYWRRAIQTDKPLKILDFSAIDKLVKKYGIYCMVGFIKQNHLLEVLNVGNKYLVLGFEKCEIAIRYNVRLEKFLADFIRNDIKSIRNITEQIGLTELSKILTSKIEEKSFQKSGEMTVYELAAQTKNENITTLTSSKFFDSLPNGVFFDELLPQGYMAIKQNVICEDEQAKMFSVCRIDRDFIEFLNRI